MRGLIYKDFLCLRKGLKTFGFVTLGVIVLAVMFLLSSQYGNLAGSLQEIRADASVGADMMMGMLETSVWFMLFIPIAFMADVAQCFREDARVGFGKPLAGMALSHLKIVGSRYLTTLIYGTVSMGASLAAAFSISSVSVELTMQSLAAGVLNFGAIFLIYMSLNLFLIYLCGARKADLIQMIPLVVLLIVVGSFVMKNADMTDEEMSRLLLEWKDRITLFLQGGYKMLFPVAAVTYTLSYLGSVAVLKHRRRVL
ncbi:MAG: ABC-2 transporter permease [Lachnospiraceae bacterium]|nr:ABC-2 transporter permease [Lachnospiraceae bacterium]